MKKCYVLIAVAIVLSLFSCKKAIENQQKKAVMSFITNGQWVVTSYLSDTTDLTTSFDGYKFKFEDNGTVSGNNGNSSATGTWVGEVSDYSITSDFPGAGDPYQKLNGHWIIKDSGLTFVKAVMTVNGITMHLHLTKVP